MHRPRPRRHEPNEARESVDVLQNRAEEDLRETARRIDEARTVFNANGCDALRLERSGPVGLNGVPLAMRKTGGHERDSRPVMEPRIK